MLVPIPAFGKEEHVKGSKRTSWALRHAVAKDLNVQDVPILIYGQAYGQILEHALTQTALGGNKSRFALTIDLKGDKFLMRNSGSSIFCLTTGSQTARRS